LNPSVMLAKLITLSHAILYWFLIIVDMKLISDEHKAALESSKQFIMLEKFNYRKLFSQLQAGYFDISIRLRFPCFDVTQWMPCVEDLFAAIWECEQKEDKQIFLPFCISNTQRWSKKSSATKRTSQKMCQRQQEM